MPPGRKTPTSRPENLVARENERLVGWLRQEWGGLAAHGWRPLIDRRRGTPKMEESPPREPNGMGDRLDFPNIDY